MPVVTIDGETHEVELSDIQFADGETPDGFVSTAKFTDTVRKEKAKAKKSLRSELLADTAFQREVAEALGVELREDGTPKGSPKDTTALEARFKAQHVAPLQEQLQTAQAQAERYRARALEADILAAATEAGVKPSFLKPAPGQDKAPIVSLLEGSFGYDPEADAWGVKDGVGDDGSPVFRYATGGKMAGAPDLLSEMRSGDGFADYFASTSMKGSDHQSAQTTQGRTYTNAEITQLASDPETWSKHRDDVKAAIADGRVRD